MPKNCRLGCRLTGMAKTSKYSVSVRPGRRHLGGPWSDARLGDIPMVQRFWPEAWSIGRLPTANPPVAAIRRCQGRWICLQPCRAVPFGAFRTSGNCLWAAVSTGIHRQQGHIQSKTARPTVVIPDNARDAGQGSEPGDGRRPWLENSLENLLEKSAVQRSQTHAINQLDTVSAGSTYNGSNKSWANS
jgi:hypothetical protein